MPQFQPAQHSVAQNWLQEVAGPAGIELELGADATSLPA
jgi:hypothetical protein